MAPGQNGFAEQPDDGPMTDFFNCAASLTSCWNEQKDQ